MAQLLSGTRIYGTGTVDTQLFVSGSNVSTSTNTGALQVVGGVGIGGNLYVGGTINGTILLATTATYANQVQTAGTAISASYYPTFVDSNNSSTIPESLYTTSSFSINPSTGNVGIGTFGLVTTAPLHVAAPLSSGTIVTVGMFTQNIDTAVTVGSGARLILAAGNSQSRAATIEAAVESGLNAHYLAFSTNASGASPTEKMRIAAGGNVGIGTTSSSAKLHVVGTESRFGGVASGYISIYNAVSRSGYIQANGGTDLRIASDTDPMTFLVGGTERVRITANGGIAFGGVANYGANGSVLVSAGDAAPVWTAVGQLYAGNATTATQLNTQLSITNAAYYPSFVDSNNITAIGELHYTTSSFAINPGTGVLTLGSTVNAVSSTTGALVIAGGVGIRQNLYVGGTITLPVSTASIVLGDTLVPAGISTIVLGRNTAGDAASITSNAGTFYSGITNLRLFANTAGQHIDIASYSTAGWGPTGTNNGVRLRVDGATGDIKIFNNTAATSTNTGALQVVGGVGIGGDLYVGGTINGAISGTLTGLATTATNLAGGNTAQVAFQTAVGRTSFTNTGTTGSILVSQGTISTGPTFVNTSSIKVGYATTANTFEGGSAQAIVYQSAANSTAFLVSANTSGYILASQGISSPPAWVNPTNAVSPANLTVQANVSAFEYVVGVAGSGSSQSAYIATNSNSQFGFNASTGFIGLGTTVPISKLHINETGGAASQVRIEGHNASGITIVTNSQPNGAFVGFDGSGGFNINQKTANLPIYLNFNGTVQFLVTSTGAVSFGGVSNYGSSGQVLQTNGSGSAPTWVSASNLTAGNATTATNIAGGTVGQLHFQTGPGATSFAGPGTAGQLLVSAGASATGPVFTNTASIRVGFATNATTLENGTAQSIPYQSSIGVTSFLAAGTAGQVLQTNGTGSAPTWVSTGSLTAGIATTATQLNTIQQISNATYYPTFVDSNNSTSLAEIYYTTSSFSINPATGIIYQGPWPVSTSSGVSVLDEGILLTPVSLTSLNFVGDGVTASVATGGSISFAGNTQWLSVPSVTGLNLGDPSYPGALDGPNFTIEFWMYATSAATDVYIMDKDGVSGTSYAQYGFKMSTGRVVTFYVGHGDNASTVNGSEQSFTVGTVALNTWYHVAVTQSATNQIKTFLNGVLTSTTTRTQKMVDGGKALLIGWCQNQPTNARFTGYLTNIRIIKGTAQYTSSFTTPTTSLTAVSGTSLLLTATTPATFLTDSSTNNANITNNGTVAYISSSPLVSGSITVTVSTTTLVSSAFTATNIAGGNTAQILFQTSPGKTSFISTGTAGQILVSAGTTSTGPIFTNTSSIRVAAATSATTLENGTAQSIPYQSAIGVTSFLAAGTAGQILQTNGSGSAPTWVSTGSLIAGIATTATQLNTIQQISNATYYPTFVDSNNSTSLAEIYYTTSSFSINPATSSVSIGTSTNNVFDQVSGARPLVVQKSDASTTVNGSLAAITISNSDTTTNNTAQINFAAITGASTNQYSAATISAIFGARTNAQYPTGQLVFSTASALNSAPTEKMRITNAGNVGINGTPTFKFDVGINNQTQSISVGSNGLIRNATAADLSPFTQARIVVYGGTSVDTANWGYFGYGSDASLRIVYGKTGAGAPLIFGTTSAMDGTGTFNETMRLDINGRLGIGTTSPSALLHVSSGTNATLNYPTGTWAAKIYQQNDITAYNGLIVSNRWQADTATVFEVGNSYGSSSAWGSFYKVTGVGTHIWGSGGSGTERMRITTNGGIAFGGSTSYGTSGQILKSNGDAAPTWVDQSTITAGSATDSTKLPLAGGTMTGTIVGKTNTGGDYSASNDTGSMSVRGNASNGAFISFHRPSLYAVNVGLDTDNIFKIGGWSASTTYVGASAGSLITTGGATIGTTSTDANVRLLVQNSGGQNVAWFKNFSGTRASPTENADWPWPVMALTGYGNYYRQTMLSFTLPNDAVSQTNGIYHTDNSVWNFRLNGVTGSWDNTVASTTPIAASTAEVGLELLGPGNLRIGTSGAKNIYFRTNGTDRAYIDSSGNMNITNSLTVSSGNTSGGGLILADDGDIVDLNDGYCSMRFSSGVRVYSAKSSGSPVILLANSGAITANGEITAYGAASDVRLKENIVELEGSLLKVQKLKGYNFNYIGKEDKLLGVIAQEIEQVVPEVVYEFNDVNNGTYKAVRYEHLTVLLIEAMNEQQAIIERQQKQIDQIQAMLAELLNK